MTAHDLQDLAHGLVPSLRGAMKWAFGDGYEFEIRNHWPTAQLPALNLCPDYGMPQTTTTGKTV
jgi:hypothetical protein